MPETEVTPKQRIEQFAERHKITMTAEFINWHNSRNAKEKSPSLNWKVSLLRNGRVFLTTDYGAGCGHCPGNKADVSPAERKKRIEWEGENGKPGKITATMGITSRYRPTGLPIGGQNKTMEPIRLLPELADVLHSLASDAEVLNAGDFDCWASDFGYDTDSRAAEATYNACVEIAVKLQSGIGPAAMIELYEACQDY